MQSFNKASSSEDDGTGFPARHERRKRQNRLNQRALRNRKRREESKVVLWSRPYRIDRWRVGTVSGHHAQPSNSSMDRYLTPAEDVDDHTANAVVRSMHGQINDLDWLIIGSPAKASGPLAPKYSKRPACPEPPPFVFPLSADHLLHLIHYNVYRALLTNKSLLNETTFLTQPHLQEPIPIFPSTLSICDGLTIIHPGLKPSLPQSLYPTSLQMSRPHSSWINMFPFSRLRDNLIDHEDTFDGYELCYDLFGELSTNYPIPGPSPRAPESSVDGLDPDGDDIAARRNGLIVWGEPWDVTGWELTPKFVRKWVWLLGGCETLIEVSNQWRALRGEDSLRLGDLELGQLPETADH
jgi:hypothetical protein